MKSLNGYYYVQSQGVVTTCKVRGRFKKDRFSLTVGDRVVFTLLDDGQGVIERIEPRRSVLHRPLVANVDQVVVTFAARHPDLHTLLLDRFLVLASHAEIFTVICINKMDLADEDLTKTLARYEKIGFPVLRVSAEKDMGITALAATLKDKVSVFCGPSGVGKSTLLNCLEPQLTLRTGSVSDKIKRGKHTTRAAELLPLSHGGFVVDTPGFSFTSFEHIPAISLAGDFPEFAPFRFDCRYATCLHSHEPNCAVKKAVADGAIDTERYESYLSVLNDIQNVKKSF